MVKTSALAVASLALAGLALVGCAKKVEEPAPAPDAPKTGYAPATTTAYEPVMIPAANRESVRMNIDKIDCGGCASKLEDVIKAKGVIQDFKIDSKGNVEFVFDKTKNEPEDFATAVNSGTTMTATIQG